MSVSGEGEEEADPPHAAPSSGSQHLLKLANKTSSSLLPPLVKNPSKDRHEVMSNTGMLDGSD